MRYGTGGLNLADIRVKELALKATWPQVLIQEEDYAKIVYSFIQPTLGENIWRCNIKPEDVKANFMLNKIDFTRVAGRNNFWRVLPHSGRY